MQIELSENEANLMKWAISMMSSQLLQNIIRTKQEIRNSFSQEEQDELQRLEENPDNLSPEQVNNLKAILKGKELKDNISNWQNQIKELKDLDRKIPTG